MWLLGSWVSSPSTMDSMNIGYCAGRYHCFPTRQISLQAGCVSLLGSHSICCLSLVGFIMQFWNNIFFFFFLSAFPISSLQTPRDRESMLCLSSLGKKHFSPCFWPLNNSFYWLFPKRCRVANQSQNFHRALSGEGGRLFFKCQDPCDSRSFSPLPELQELFDKTCLLNK